MPLLAVALDTAWQLHRDSVVGVTVWHPSNVTFRFQSHERTCSPSLEAALERTSFRRDTSGSLVGSEPNMASDAVELRGTHWLAIRGAQRVRLRDEDAGYVNDAISIFEVVAQRAPDCWDVLAVDSASEYMSEDELWYTLESMRFNGADPRRELPNQIFGRRRFDYHTRVGVVHVDAVGTSCIELAQPVPLGTPVTIVSEYGELENGVTYDTRDHCETITARMVPPGGNIYRIVVRGNAIGSPGIGILATRNLRKDGAVVRGDLDGDRIDEEFEMCTVAKKLAEYRVVSGKRPTRSLWWSARLIGHEVPGRACS